MPRIDGPDGVSPEGGARVPSWLTGAFIISLVIALFQFLYSLTEDYLGECSFDTGYEPDAGIMGIVPVVMIGLGLFEIVVPASLQRRDNKRHLYVLGAAVAVFGLAAWIAVGYAKYRHACD